ncbi:hypothetical protein WHR41_06171 [Cladosporium halotolerans]|uniref:PHD-type domain-containing protein n=1 Tax=Cladosporium halotolerans TaxID=1052096 RepID=A0AB34KJK5_9PEZI
MSFSLSSLLNADAQQQQQQQHQAQQEGQRSPTSLRKESPPSKAHLQSPEQHHVSLPQYTPPPNIHRTSPPQAQDAIHALASLSASTAPPPTQWNGHTAPQGERHVRRESIDRRPSSSHISHIELPPPPPADAHRKMSSPTLDQYHVASRSPEQRKASLVAGDATFTLPPMQHVTSPTQDKVRRPSLVSEQLSPGSRPATHESGGSLAQTEREGKPNIETEPSGSHAPIPSISEPSNAIKEDNWDLSPAHIKQEPLATPQATSPVDARRPSVQLNDMAPSSSKTLNSLKRENSTRHQSPLRESSVPMPSTEDVLAESTVPKKRPLPKKKGTATVTKKAPPAKKRKVESIRSDTPSSRVSKPGLKTGSGKGTPINSSPAPSNRSGSMDPDDEEEEEEEEGTPVSDDLYCLCKRPDTGTFMIGCDGTCDDWFHGKCVGIEERDKNLIDKYMCPRCTDAGIGRTTWKRMCRRSGCRLPARVGKNKTGKEGSKYCSDECGVAFFRQMTANTRGREAAAKNRSTRHRPSHHAPESHAAAPDQGARGGVLAPSEVRALLDSSHSLTDFKKLGEGVLSPPATPDSKANGSSSAAPQSQFTDPEQAALASIAREKNASRARHQLLKDRLKFINMAKQAAARACTEKELKPKDYCGFDPRLEWSEERFASWRASAAGVRAFELETLAVEGADEMADVEQGEQAGEVCDRKKCARHHDWQKLATDDARFEMGDNGDRMRALDREEREIRERAAMRARAGGELQGEGSVEVHGLGIQVDGGSGETVKGAVDAEVPVPESVVPAVPLSEVMQVDASA